MAGRALFLAITIGLLAFAGCIQEPTAIDPESLPHSHGPMLGEFSMTATDCEEGGFSALYPMSGGQKRADVWELADVRQEYGNPIRDGTGRPLNGPAMANIHQGFRCKSAGMSNATQQDYIFGWVGNMIKAPAWDPGGADVHFLLAGFGFGNGSIAETLRASNNAAISHAYAPTAVTWYVPKESPRPAVHAIYSDVEKGIYVSYSTLEKYRDVPQRTLRFWWQVPTDGTDAHAGHSHGGGSEPATNGTWHPIYWDMQTSGGPQWTTPPVDSPELACHLGNDDHASSPTGKALGGACQPTLTSVYHHRSLTISQGHLFEDVTLTQIWEH